ncbi:MAG: GPH family glycoside/pentoside/hexuronide:cation symporter [Bacteroidia bacterium]
MAQVNFGAKLAYGIGSVPYAVKDAAFATFVLFFYTQVLGLSGSLTGLAIFLSVLWDAVSDPMVGAWSDRLKTRWGRRHPAMLIGTLPLAASFVMIFSPAEFVQNTQGPLFGWLLLCVLMMRTFLTVFYIPHKAMGAEISDDYLERSSIVNYRTNLGWIAGVTLPAISLVLLFVDVGEVDGRLVYANYELYGWTSFTLVIAASTICIIGSWKFIPRLLSVAQRSVEESPGFMGMVRDTVATLQNANFRRIFVLEIAVGGAMGVMGALQMITWTYFWELSSADIALLLVASLVAVACTFPGMAWLGKHWEKQTLLKFAVIGLFFNSLWFIPGRLLGILPENGTTILFALIFINAAITTGLTILRTVSLYSILADIADEHELATGRRQEGVFFAASTFALKFVMGFGYMVGGPLLDIVGLQSGVAPGEASESALFGIGMVVGPIVTVMLLVPWWMAARIDVSKEKLREVQAALQERDVNQPAL